MVNTEKLHRAHKKYGLTTREGHELCIDADVIILVGIVYKDRVNQYRSTDEYNNIFDFEDEDRKLKLIIGCETQYGKQRLFKNFTIGEKK